MRTLRTEMRLRRLIRQHALAVEALSGQPLEPAVTGAAERRLRALLTDVRTAWAADLAVAATSEPTGELALLDGHVDRSLKAVEAAIGGLGRPGSQLPWLAERFRAAALPLLVFVRGLEETPSELLRLAPRPALARSA